MSSANRNAMRAPTVNIAYVKLVDNKPTLAKAFKDVNTNVLLNRSRFAAKQIRDGAPRQRKLQIPGNVIIVDGDLHPSCFRAVMHMLNRRTTRPSNISMAGLRIINPDIPDNHIAEGATLKILNYLKIDRAIIDISIRESLLRRISPAMTIDILQGILCDVFSDTGLARLAIRRVLEKFSRRTETEAREFVEWCKEHGCGAEAEAQMAVLAKMWRDQEAADAAAAAAAEV